MEPLLFEPYYQSPVWGGPRLAKARGLDWSEGDTHGESFDVSKLKFDDEKARKPTWVESDPFFVEEGSLYLGVKQPGFSFTIR